MKKAIIVTTLVAILGTAVVVSAKIPSYDWKESTSASRITNSYFDENSAEFFKVVDDKTTCYILKTHVSKNRDDMYNYQLTCVK